MLDASKSQFLSDLPLEKRKEEAHYFTRPVPA
jgi:hypothetical protein